VADDDAQVRDGITDFLEQSGYHAIACSDPEAAAEVCEHYRPDVALVDICFSGPFGFEGLSLIEQLRGMQPDATIIAMSGRGARGLAEQAVLRGATSFLPKPFAPDELVRRLPDVDTRHGDAIRLPSIDELIAADRFAIHVQPIVDLLDERTIGWEALARVSSAPPFGSPVGLLRYARRKGRLPDVNRACIAEALRSAGRLTELGLLFINVDPELLAAGPAYAGTVAAILRERNIHPRSLVFEVTERGDISSPACIDAIAALRELGIAIALDDVGGGYVQFPLLESILPSFMKIPLELGGGIATNKTSRLVVSHLVEMAHEVGCRVVVEGIESADGAAAARELSIDFAQGYHFGRPMPPAEVRT